MGIQKDGTELGYHGGMTDGNVDGKLEISIMGNSVVSEGVNQILPSKGISGWDTNGKIEGSYMGD